jgi:phosphomannomutase
VRSVRAASLADKRTSQIEWERHAEAIVNADSPTALQAALAAALAERPGGEDGSHATLLLATDTRLSGPALAAAAAAGAASLGALVHDLGPQHLFGRAAAV